MFAGIRLSATGQRRGTRASGSASRLVCVTLVAAIGLVGSSRAAEAINGSGNVVQGTINRACEVSLHSSKTYGDAFNDVVLDALVTAPDGGVQVVPAFSAGGSAWRFRYSAPSAGEYRYQTRCSDQSNGDLHDRTGTMRFAKYEGANAFYRHGPIRVAADRRHFEHADGTPFVWLGDTWWMGLCKRLKWPEEFQSLAADRAEKGFNVVQIVAGLYPDMPAFDERGANEAGFPWERDYARINPAYFDAADRRLEYLADHGLAPCIVGAWGYHLPWLGVERMKKHWRYLVARWGAYPVIWCVAGEGPMPFYLSKTQAADSEFQKRGWTEVAAYLRSIDPYHHPVSIHPSDMARRAVSDPAVLDFEMLQTGHSDRASIGPTLGLVAASRAAKPVMPTVNAEVCYEGIMGTCSAALERFMVWSCFLSGTAGHTYGANGIWQVNRREQPYGKSPAGNNWGTTPWDEAMALAGSRQTGFARKLLERFEWWRFEPHPEWAAAVSDDALNAKFTWGDWIWYPEGNPAVNAPAERRFFRKTFILPERIRPATAILHISADDRFIANVNGVRVGSHHDWQSPQRYDVTRELHAGENLLAVEAENVAANVAKNPAGLICCLQVTIATGNVIEIRTDATWHSSNKESNGWQSPTFDDHNWPLTMVAAKYGEPPWGMLRANDPPSVFAAGIGDKTRVVYISQPVRVRINALEPTARYQSRFFDPVSGNEADLGPAAPDAKGAWLSPPPPAGTDDWVLILERR